MTIIMHQPPADRESCSTAEQTKLAAPGSQVDLSGDATIVGHSYKKLSGKGIVVMAYAIISSFIFVTLFCWWSLPCSYIAIILGAVVSLCSIDSGEKSPIVIYGAKWFRPPPISPALDNCDEIAQ